MNFRVSGKILFVWQHWKKFGVDRAEITFPKKNSCILITRFI